MLHSGSNYYVRILSTIDRELLKPNASVALHKHSNALVDVLPPEADSSIMMLTSGTLRTGPGRAGPDRTLDSVCFAPTDQKPDVMYADIGGMDIQKQEVREAVELPLTHFELYKQVRIRVLTKRCFKMTFKPLINFTKVCCCLFLLFGRESVVFVSFSVFIIYFPLSEQIEDVFPCLTSL